MIRPTTRAVLIFVCGIPLSLLVVVYDSSLWILSLNYAALVLVTIGFDAPIAFPPRQLKTRVTAPERLYIGERGAIQVHIAAAGRRGARFELIAEQRGEVDPPEIVSAELTGGQPAHAALAIVPRRRGRVHIDQIWVRWRGPLSLIEFARRIPVDRDVDVLPNVRGVQGAALQFFAQEAIYGIKSQRQKGEGAEFEALRAYSPLHNVRAGVCYPSTLITTADHDDRVVPWHSFKFAAELQHRQSCGNPVLLRVETRAGHGSGKPVWMQIEDYADQWAFLVRSLHME